MHEVDLAPVFTDTPGDHALSRMQRGLHYSQAVRYPSSARVERIELSGQGGWDRQVRFPDRLDDEIRAAFDNVEEVLAAAGAGWQHVTAIESFHVADSASALIEQHNGVMVEQLRERLGEVRPIWTQIAVPALGAPGMRVEIRATAVVPASERRIDGDRGGDAPRSERAQ